MSDHRSPKNRWKYFHPENLERYLYGKYITARQLRNNKKLRSNLKKQFDEKNLYLHSFKSYENLKERRAEEPVFVTYKLKEEYRYRYSERLYLKLQDLQNDYSIYMAFSPKLEVIKIGRSQSLETRLKGLHYTLADDLILLGFLKSNGVIETALHYYFDKYRKNRAELFVPHAEIFEFAKKYMSNDKESPKFWKGF